MKNKKTNGNEGAMNAQRTKRLLLIITAAFLAFILLLGCVLGIASAVKRSSYAMYYKGVGINEGVARCLATYYKGLCIRLLNQSQYNPENTDEFWSSVYDEQSGETFGEFLSEFVSLSIKNLIASSVIFNTELSLTQSDKKKIETAIEERLNTLYKGNKSDFNKDCEKYGFDFKDFKSSMELVYKARVLSSRIFGEGGAGILSDLEYCEEFFAGYARVKFIFIRTEDTVLRGEDGKYTVKELTEDEREERLALIEKIKACVDGINSGERDPGGFDSYAEQVKTLFGEIGAEELAGYYLYNDENGNSSAFTKAFSGDYPDVAKKALSLSVGKGAYLSCDDENGGFEGICFMYRDEIAKGTYPYYYDVAEDGFFADFASLAANSLTSSMIDKYAAKVEESDKWSSMMLTEIPYSMLFWVSFS